MASKIFKKVISTTKAPSAIGPYSQAIQTGQLIFVSGQIGMDTATKKLVDGGVQAQTQKALENMKAILGEAGCTMDNVVKATVLLSDMNDFDAVNKIYATFFQTEQPARAAYQVAALPKGGLVEIEAIAVANGPSSSL